MSHPVPATGGDITAGWSDAEVASARSRKVRQRMALPYEAVLASSNAVARSGKGAAAASGGSAAVPVETAVYCTAVLERVCCALLQSSIDATESVQDDPFWNRRGKVVREHIRH